MHWGNGQGNVYTISLIQTQTSTGSSSYQVENRTLHAWQIQTIREEISLHCSLTAKSY